MQAMIFPRHLDSPKRLLFWTADQVVPFVMFLGLGIITSNAFLGLLIGGLSSWLFTRFRNSSSDGVVMHAAYWYGIVPLKGRSALDAFEKRVYPS